MMKKKTLFSVAALSTCAAVAIGSAIAVAASGESDNSIYGVSQKKSSVEYKNDSIYVSLSKGDTFVYNQPIDLKAHNNTENLISIYTNPSISGVADVGSYVIRITDLYDENNYVEMEAHGAQARGSSDTYVLAGRSGEEWAGLEACGSNTNLGLGTRIVDYEGTKYRLYNDGQIFGTTVYSPFYGEYPYKDKELGDAPLNLSYDYSTHRIYATPIPSDKSSMIIDLDDEEFFSSHWDGFKTGEVVLSIYARDYRMSSFNFVIEDINGEDLSKTEKTAVVKSIIEVDAGDEVAYAIVGKPYRVYDAKFFTSVLEESTTSVRVFKNYYSTTKSELNIVGGAFVPTSKGIYTIEYKAISGQEVEIKTVDVVAYGADKATTSIDVDTTTLSSVVFSEINLPEYSIVNANGEVVSKVEVIAPSGEIFEVTDSFVPTESGKYTVKYSVTDYVQTVSKNVTLDVMASDVPYVEGTPSLRAAYIKGASTTFPSLTAYAVVGGKVESFTANLYTVDDCDCSGECTCQRKAVDGLTTITANEKLTLIYSAQANGKTVEKSFDVKVVDTGIFGETVNIGKYFLTSDGVVFDAETREYRGSNIGGDATFGYILPLPSWRVGFGVTTNSQKANYGRLEFSIVDTENSKNAISVSLRQIDAKNTEGIINGETYIFNFGLKENYSLNVSYDRKTGKLSLGNKTVTVRVDGEIPTFGDTVNFDFSLVDVSGDYAVRVDSVCGEEFSGKYDMVAPTIYFNEDFDTEVIEKGDVIRLSKVTIADLLDPNPTLTLKVLSPSGNYVVATDGTVLDGSQDYSKEYDFVLNEYGSYQIVSCGTDGNENSTGDNYKYITVADTVAPNVTLSEKVESGKVGSNIAVAKVAITDDVSDAGNCKTSIYLVANGGLGKVTKIEKIEGGSFVVDKAGVYVLCYYVYDEANNLTVVKYEVTVTA